MGDFDFSTTALTYSDNSVRFSAARDWWGRFRSITVWSWARSSWSSNSSADDADDPPPPLGEGLEKFGFGLPNPDPAFSCDNVRVRGRPHRVFSLRADDDALFVVAFRGVVVTKHASPAVFDDAHWFLEECHNRRRDDANVPDDDVVDADAGRDSDATTTVKRKSGFGMVFRGLFGRIGRRICVM